MTVTEDLRPARIGHVLFLDLIGFTTLELAEQTRRIERLKAVTIASPTFRSEQARDALLVLPTGDGMALVFHDDLAAPARCAVELSRGLSENAPAIPVRIGIHSGLVQTHLDLTGRENLVGEGINTAHRVMECGEDGYILASGEYASWLRARGDWPGEMAELGTVVVKHGLRLEIMALGDGGVGKTEPIPLRRADIGAPEWVGQATADTIDEPPAGSVDVVLLYRRNIRVDTEVMDTLERELTARGLSVFVDRSSRIGVESHRQQEAQLRFARAVIPIVSPHALRSEMLQYALEIALDARSTRGLPTILPVQIGPPENAEHEDDLAIRDLIAPFPYFLWNTPEDSPRLVAELLSALREPVRPREIPLEAVVGGMDPSSPFYIKRNADREFSSFLDSRHSILLVRGGRQIGKTSLLAQGMKQVREKGWRLVRTDFQKLSGSSLSDPAVFYRQLALSLSRQVKFPYDFGNLWDEISDPGQNFEYFLRDLLDSAPEPLVWFMDEADKMFSAPFSTDFFGLVRSWHNDRAAEPDGPLSLLTVAIAYATEAHLFISDLNQSPFNVGERIALEDFTLEQTLHLNEIYGNPVGARGDMEKLHRLLGGQPYLTRRALDVLAREKTGFDSLLRESVRDDGPFADHLKRVHASIAAQPEVTQYVRALLTGPAIATTASDSFYRLLRAGVVRQASHGTIIFRCELYRDYLAQHIDG